MAGKRKSPRLRFTGRYYVVNIYTPDGRRTMISFGPADERSEAEIYAAFGKWLPLFQRQPHKVLSFGNPYEAVERMMNPADRVTAGELSRRYLRFAEENVRPVRSNKEHPDLRFVIRAREFLKPYHNWPVANFGPDELRAVQDALVKHRYVHGRKRKSYTRRGINDTLGCIRKIWMWGMGRQLVTAEQIQGLKEVRALRMGDAGAPDKAKRPRVTEEEFKKVVGAVNPVVGDMLRLVWHTAMRPQEVCSMRPSDIVRGDSDCWVYVPGRESTPVGDHKTTRFERVRVIPLTAVCQGILGSRVRDFGSKEHIFSPAEAVREFLNRRAERRKTPLSCGNSPGTNRKEHPMIRPGDCYSHSALRIACKRGCARAGVGVFVPYDLRRTAATRIRSRLGKEAARVLLGHVSGDTTDVYLLEEVQEAVKVAKLLA
jgi:integrase